MMQTDLFTGATSARHLARRDGPATSRAAAESVARFAGQHHETILQVLRDHGARGLTVHEIAAFCRLDAHAIGKRCGELERGGEIKVKTVAGQEITRPSPSGRRARVWVLVQEGGTA